MRYNSPAIQFPTSVKDGTVKRTPAGPGKVLFSLGRRSARGGIKHLGVLDQAEALAVYVALDQAFGLAQIVADAKSAKEQAQAS